MKFRNFKKTLSMMLTFALVMGIISSGLVSESEANPWTFTDVSAYQSGNTPINIQGGISVIAGSIVRFHNIKIRTSTNQISNQSIQLSIDGFHTPVTVSNGGDRSAMLTKGGNVSTIKLNNPNSQTLYVTFTMTYNSNIKTYNLRVITDTNSSSIIVPTTTCTDLATDTFRSTFGIQFNRISTSANTNLSGACPRTSDNEICIGGISQCGLFCDLLKSHHKSAERIINIDKASSSEYVLRFVNYRICADDWSHKEVGGIAYVKERNTLVSYKSMGATYAVFAVQHELGHNLGVSEHCNGNNQNCVMKTGPDDPYALKGKWCTSCSTAIFDNK